MIFALQVSVQKLPITPEQQQQEQQQNNNQNLLNYILQFLLLLC